MVLQRHEEVTAVRMPDRMRAADGAVSGGGAAAAPAAAGVASPVVVIETRVVPGVLRGGV